MGSDYIGHKRLAPRVAPAPPFLNDFGLETTRSVSIATANVAGKLYLELPNGQVLAQHKTKFLFFPCAADLAAAAVADGNEVSVTDARQFFVGDYVELPLAVSATTARFRKVTARDEAAGTITLDGATFSLSEGDALEVDPSRSVAPVTADVTGAAALNLGDDSTLFTVGQIVEVGGTADLEVISVDHEAGTITVSDDVTVTAGAIVASAPNGNYKIMVDSVHTSEMAYTPQNVLAPTRSVGEVREWALTGLTARARVSLSGMIEFRDVSY